MTNNNPKNNETNLMNKFNGKPPYNFNQEDAKEIDNKFIEVSKEDLIEDTKINSNNKWYKKFKLFGKTFIQMSKNNIASKLEYVIYYCSLHTTTIDNDKFFPNGNKKKLSKKQTTILKNKGLLQSIFNIVDLFFLELYFILNSK